MLNSEKYQQKVAAAVYRGILRYFTEKEILQNKEDFLRSLVNEVFRKYVILEM